MIYYVILGLIILIPPALLYLLTLVIESEDGKIYRKTREK